MSGVTVTLMSFGTGRTKDDCLAEGSSSFVGEGMAGAGEVRVDEEVDEEDEEDELQVVIVGMLDWGCWWGDAVGGGWITLGRTSGRDGEVSILFIGMV